MIVKKGFVAGFRGRRRGFFLQDRVKGGLGARNIGKDVMNEQTAFDFVEFSLALLRKGILDSRGVEVINDFGSQIGEV